MPKKKTPLADSKTVVDLGKPKEQFPENGKEIAVVRVADGPEALLSRAIDAGASIDTIERLMVLRKDMLAEKAKQAFNEAMAAFQAECPVIEKKKEVKDANKKLLYCYAPLDSIVSQVKEILQKHGFSYAIKTKTTDGRITVICIAKHKDGHYEESDLEVPSTGGTSIMSGPQKTAAALTFAKRYAFCNAFGIMTGDEDTDATKETVEAPPEPKVVTELEVKQKQVHAIWNDICKAKGIEDAKEKTLARHKAMDAFFNRHVEHLSDLNLQELKTFIAQLQEWEKVIKKPAEMPFASGADAAQDVFPGAKAVEEPPKTPTQPSPVSASKTPAQNIDPEEISGMEDWIDKSETLDEVNEIWEEIKKDQVRIKQMEGAWIRLHQRYVKRRAALKKLD